MKFGQLIEYNVRNIFLKKPCSKYDGKTIPRRFSEKLKVDQLSETLNSLFLLYV